MQGSQIESLWSRKDRLIEFLDICTLFQVYTPKDTILEQILVLIAGGRHVVGL